MKLSTCGIEFLSLNISSLLCLLGSLSSISVSQFSFVCMCVCVCVCEL